MPFNCLLSFLASIAIAPCPGAVGKIDSGKIDHLFSLSTLFMYFFISSLPNSIKRSNATLAKIIASSFPDSNFFSLVWIFPLMSMQFIFLNFTGTSLGKT